MRIPRAIVSAVQLPTSPRALYTVPPNVLCIVRRATFANSSDDAALVNVWLVPSGGTPSSANQVLKGKVVGPGETWSAPDLEGHVMEAGSTLQASSGTAGAVALFASGIEIA